MASTHRRARAALRTALSVLSLTMALAGFALTGPAAAAPTPEGKILRAGSPHAIKNSYIVVLDSAVLDGARVVVSEIAKDLAGRYHGTLRRTYSAALRGFAVTMNEQQARRLAADPRIAYVEQDQAVRLAETQTPTSSWGLDRIDQRNLPLNNAYTYSTTASNVHAYVIDTGIRVSHSDFGGRAHLAYDSVGDGQNGNDCHGHGTHAAGILGGSVYGVAKGVQLYAVRVLDCQGAGSISDVIAGVDWVTQNAKKPAVTNMSLGGGASSSLDNAVKNSIASGVTYAIAAGNGDFLGNPQDACTVSPARTPEAITVGATDSSDRRASFSNYGTCVDIFAPGVDITSAWGDSDTATNTVSGTSMASPHVAGAAALYLAAHPSATPQQVHDTLVDNATSGVIQDPGDGSPNRLLYVGGGGADPPPPPPADYFENTTDMPIPDAGPARYSSITVTGLSGNAPATLKIGVDIKHTYRGDLVIDLVSPDGSTYRLKNSSPFDRADNVITTYTVNASSDPANGVWKLKVRDLYRGDTGYLDAWNLTF
ncbi:serine protease [Carbonactinospora thermoautotrophica]|uniref:S8 family peptidase n=1 Tax=Carbonactinospora thermoautotrophica TaxID=1469144 RepID=UPI00226D5FDC|nr:S8 family peptidase [Carbonactinospora thermoautotrophica]MCX9191192.1 serine protease [Carbonactinospora thermoautotrophica]